MTGAASEQRPGVLAAETICPPQVITQVLTSDTQITRVIDSRDREFLVHQEVTADGAA